VTDRQTLEAFGFDYVSPKHVEASLREIDRGVHAETSLSIRSDLPVNPLCGVLRGTGGRGVTSWFTQDVQIDERGFLLRERACGDPTGERDDVICPDPLVAVADGQPERATSEVIGARHQVQFPDERPRFGPLEFC
jgi:hypothetical protein